MLHRRSFLVLTGALMLAPRGLRAAAAPYAITVIPAPAGTNSPSPTGINAHGDVVGVAFSTDQAGATVITAFIFKSGASAALNQVGARTYADATNATGDAAGSAINGQDLPMQAVKWQNGVAVILPGASSSGDSSAYGINDKGDVAGSSTVTKGEANWTHAVLWPNGAAAATDLGTLGGDSSEASSINASGQIAGAAGVKPGEGSLLLDASAHAFLWANGTMQDLGTLGGDSSSANALNDKGQVVGWSGTKPGGGALAFDVSARAFVWDSGRMVNLGGLPGGSISTATAINNHGVIVGFAIDGNNSQRAVAWINGEIIDLNTLIPGDSGYTLTAAYGVNDAGQIVCSATSSDGSNSALILTPPPASATPTP